MVVNATRWIVRDLDAMPDDWGWKRYEIIEGELFVTRAPHVQDQDTGSNICFELTLWTRRTQLGRASEAPSLVLTEFDSVIPDVVWASNERREHGIDEAGHFTAAPGACCRGSLSRQ